MDWSAETRSRVVKVLLGLSPILWLISLALPGLHFGPPYGPNGRAQMYGWEILLWGWAGILFGAPAWYANLAGAAALAFTRSYNVRGARISSWIASALALTALLIREMLKDEAGGTATATVGIGYGVWLSAIAVALIGSHIYPIAPRGCTYATDTSLFEADALRRPRNEENKDRPSS